MDSEMKKHKEEIKNLIRSWPVESVCVAIDVVESIVCKYIQSCQVNNPLWHTTSCAGSSNVSIDDEMVSKVFQEVQKLLEDEKNGCLDAGTILYVSLCDDETSYI